MSNTCAPGPGDQRHAIRFNTTLPVCIAGREGLTHNISAHGVDFEAEVQPPIGALVDFWLEFTQNGRPHRLLCEGKVVRVERHGDRFRVAARLVAPLFDDAEVAS